MQSQVKDEWIFEGKTQLSQQSIDAVTRLGFSCPTPVQRATMPLFLSFKDVVVEAITGSGKTIAFLLPLLDMLDRRKPPLKLYQVGAIIISPTRELAKQTYEVLNQLGRRGYGVQLLVGGGRDVSADIKQIKKEGCNIIVATPGRLFDLLEKSPLLGDNFEVKTLEILILDEADRLLALGFEKALSLILDKLPKQRRTGLFSATMSDAITELVRAGLRNPVKITVRMENKEGQVREELALPPSLQSFYAVTEYNNRMNDMLSHLSTMLNKTVRKAIVFFGTCATVEYFGKILPLHTFWSTHFGNTHLFALHGKMEQKKRIKVHTDFIKFTGCAILLCTDLAARGLDFQDVDLVVHYEAPQEPTTFVHRAGRTARSGRPGTSLLLVSENEEAYIDFLQNRRLRLEPNDTFQSTDGTEFVEELRALNASDRDLLEKSIRAFVSFIRFYQEHYAKFIFRLQDLNIGRVAQSFGLLKLPKMAELKSRPITDFVEAQVDTKAIRYKDERRNIQREQSFETLKRLKANRHKENQQLSSAAKRRKGYGKPRSSLDDELDLL